MVARVAGITLVALVLGVWLGRRGGAGFSGLAALLAYNALVGIYLAWLGFEGVFVGPLLWPAVILHVVVTVLIAIALAAGRDRTPAVFPRRVAPRIQVPRRDGDEPMKRHLTLIALPLAFATAAPQIASADEPKPMLMFVQLADKVEIDSEAKTLRLVDVGPQTLYFADRPERIAGHIKMDAFLEEWTAKAGADNFGDDPPNATLSVYEPGKDENTLAVLEISDPKLDGDDLVYSYEVIDGPPPTGGQATSLFIDWIGVGGGVGVGFHGVGVGLRGPGVY